LSRTQYTIYRSAKTKEPTDEFGHKRYLEKLMKWSGCPRCRKERDEYVPMQYKGKSGKTLVCPRCGFEKKTPPSPDMKRLEPERRWVARQKNK